MVECMLKMFQTCSSVSFILAFSLLAEWHEWSAQPVSTLRRGTRGHVRSECFMSGESMPAPRVNCSLPPSH